MQLVSCFHKYYIRLQALNLGTNGIIKIKYAPYKVLSLVMILILPW